MGAVLSLLSKIATVGIIVSTAKDFILSLFGKDSDERRTIDSHVTSAVAAGADPEEMQKIAVATRYEQVEKSGKNPDDFWAGLTPEEQQILKFSPQSLKTAMDRTSFLGLSGTVLFFAAFGAGLFGAARGIPILLKTLSAATKARERGASASELLTIFDQGKIEGIARVWIPGLVASLAGAGGWLASSMTNNMNDVDLWGKINLQQAEQDFNKAKGLAGGAVFGTAQSTGFTRAAVTKTAKPKLFIGTIFGGRVADVPDLVRMVDDKITSEEDLINDVQINMTRWLAALPDRLTYEIQVQSNPIDENQIRKVGIWATLALYINSNVGKRLFIDNILLGPLDPVQYFPEERRVQSITFDIPGILKPEALKNLNLSPSMLFAVDVTGNIISETVKPSLSPAKSAPAAASAVTIADTPTSSVPLARASAAIVEATQAIKELVSVSAAQPTLVAGTPIQPKAPTFGALGLNPGDKVSVDASKTGNRGLNIRLGPGTTFSIQDRAADGSRGVLISFNQSSEGFEWWTVQFEGKTPGVVAANYLLKI